MKSLRPGKRIKCMKLLEYSNRQTIIILQLNQNKTVSKTKNSDFQVTLFMTQLCGKRTHDIPIRHLPSLRTGVTLIWLEETPSSLSRERDEIVDRLCASNNCHIFRYTNVSKCLKYLKKAKSYERIVIIINIDNLSIASTDISGLCQYRQIQSIFIVSLINDNNKYIDGDLSDNTRDEIDKISEVFHDYQSLLNRLQRLVNEVNEFDDDFFTFFHRSEKAFRHLGNELGPYLWSQSLRVIFKAMSYDNSSEAKREMLAECRACCYNDPHKLAVIDEFERTYRSTDAILWYTKPCFLHRLINEALRTEDNLVLYKFRYFITDLCVRLETTALSSIGHTQSFRVYRGAKLSRGEVEKLQVGSLVATNGFFSSSKYLDVAQRFIGIDPDTDNSLSRSRDDQHQYILFEVDVDLVNSPDVVATDVSCYSTIPDENEILFNLGTTFIITGINYDNEHHVWYIRMIISSQVALINQEYNRYTFERCAETTSAISFGHLTCEILSDYPVAVKYFHRLLRSKTWNDDNRPDTYHYLACVYCHMGKYKQAIMCCQCVQLLLRRRLPEFSMTYARSMSCLSVIHSEMGDLTRAIYFHERASEIYRRILPKNHYGFAFHLNYTAYIYWQNKQYESALDVLTDTLSLVKKALPSNYPFNALTLHIIGLVQHSLNNREQSIHYFKQSLQMRESFQAADHPHVARTCYELSILYLEEKDYSAALDYAQRSLSIRKAKLPRSHQELKQSVELVELLLLRNNAIPSTQ